MKQLPNWVLTNPFPAFYDSESGSAIEQTAKVYKAMQELIKEHNTFIEQLNETIKNIDSDNAKFKECITELVENYIKLIDEKMIQQDLLITENFEEGIKNVIDSGKVKATGVYDETTESLDIKIIFDGGNE